MEERVVAVAAVAAVDAAGLRPARRPAPRVLAQEAERAPAAVEEGDAAVDDVAAAARDAAAPAARERRRRDDVRDDDLDVDAVERGPRARVRGAREPVGAPERRRRAAPARLGDGVRCPKTSVGVGCFREGGLVAGEVSPAVWWCGGVAARETRTTASACGAGDGAESTACARDAADGGATKVLSPPTCSEMKRRRDGDAVEWTRLGEGEGAWGA